MDLAEAPPTDFETISAAVPRMRRHGRVSDRARQAMRVQRMQRVYLFSTLYLLILAVFHTQDLISRTALVTIASVVCAGMVSFYSIFASGVNQKAREKNLTMPIAVFALGTLLLTMYIAPQSENVFVPFLFLVVAYGMYRLSTRTMLMLTACALIGYAAVICLHARQQPNPGELKMAMLHWLVLALTLPGFVVLAGRVRRLHSALYLAGVKIKHIEEHARRDPLLGCYNRRYTIAALEEQKRLADDSGVPLCLAVIDLDHFKSINDDVGHLAGDEVLRSFSRIAQENVRQQDIFGRYGGEEFVLVLPETSLLAALNIAERIREQTEHHSWQGALQRPVTVSIGLTQYIPGESVLDLFSRTDTAMYLAKRGGRNQVVVEEPSIELWQTEEAELSA